MSRNFEYLGETFQIQLINQLIVEKDFSHTILDVLEPTHFENKYFKTLVQLIKEYYTKYECSPSFETLFQIVKSEFPQELMLKILNDTITKIQKAPSDGAAFVQEKALKFCKQQELQKAITKSQKILDSGEFENYDKLEELIKAALQVGENNKNVFDVFNDLDDLLREDFRHPIPMGITGIDNLLKGGLAKGELGVILAPTGVGKSQPLQEPILTPNGWTEIGSLKLGDKVIGSDGLEQFVLGVYPQGLRPIYKVEFSDGTFVNCDKEHLWSVNTLNMRTRKVRKKRNNVYQPDNSYKTLKTSDMFESIKKRGRYNYRLPVVEPIDFYEKELLIDPYLMGTLLGDGCLTQINPSITTKDDEIFDNISHLQVHTAFSEYTKTDQKTIKHIRLKSSVRKSLEFYNLFGTRSDTKFIPVDYIYNSLENRIELLRGLMDTDGYVDKKGTVQFTTTSERLAKDIREIVLSLGGTVRTNSKIPTYTYNGVKKTGKLAYTITFSFSNNIVPFKLLRKVTRYRKRTKYIQQKFVKDISYIGDQEAVCIKVSNPDELYVTRDYVLTHNTTILTKIANTAFNLGFNVLQIFFEDNPKVIQRKHFTIWTGIAPDDLPNHKEIVLEKADEIKNNFKNNLYIKKMASDTYTMTQVKSMVRKMIADGNPIDMIVLDYIDCIVPDKNLGDEWKSEGSVMRGYEAMCHEIGVAGWTATQGNRSSISSEIVTTDQMGGSIKKAQVGHVIITVAKTLQQKEAGLATIAVTKSRIGKDGVVFENCKFDNEMMVIDTENSVTFLGFEENKEERKRDRIKELMEQRQQRLAEKTNN